MSSGWKLVKQFQVNILKSVSLATSFLTGSSSFVQEKAHRSEKQKHKTIFLKSMLLRHALSCLSPRCAFYAYWTWNGRRVLTSVLRAVWLRWNVGNRSLFLRPQGGWNPEFYEWRFVNWFRERRKKHCFSHSMKPQPRVIKSHGSQWHFAPLGHTYYIPAGLCN